MILLSNLKSIEGVDWMRALDLLIVGLENKLSILESIQHIQEDRGTFEVLIWAPGL